MNIRKATMQDEGELERIYAYARAFMKQTGNPNQWGDTSPSPEKVRDGIREGCAYVLCEGEHIAGAFYFRVGEDPTYRRIWDGDWLNDEPYGVLHRVASDGTVHGVLRAAVAFASEYTNNLRIDTHDDNKVMQRAIANCGFLYCGRILTDNGTERRAYQKIVRN